MRIRLVIVLVLLVLIPTAILSILAAKAVQSRELVLREGLRTAAVQGIVSVSSHLRKELMRLHARVNAELAGAYRDDTSRTALLDAALRCKGFSPLVCRVYVVALPETLVYPRWPTRAPLPDRPEDAALLRATRLLHIPGRQQEAHKELRALCEDRDKRAPIRFEAGLALAQSYRTNRQTAEAESILTLIFGFSSLEHGADTQDEEGFLYALTAGRLLAELRAEAGNPDGAAEAGLALLDRLVTTYPLVEPLQRESLAAFVQENMTTWLTGNPDLRPERRWQFARTSRRLAEQRANERFVRNAKKELLPQVRKWATTQPGETPRADWLIAGQSVYSVGPIPEVPGLIGGFRIDEQALRQAVLEAAGAIALPHGVRLALQGEPTGSEREATLVSGRLEPPFDFLSFVAAPADAGEFGQARKSRQRLYMWGIFLLAFGILLGTLSVVRQALLERRQAYARSNFAAAVSHELRTPLASMKMLTESLYLGHVQSREKRQRFLETIVRECDRLSVLIERILNFVRMEHDALACNLEQQDVGELVTTAASTFLERKQDSAVQVNVEIAPRLPSVLLDWDAVTELILNLLENAAKYSGNDKPIRVTAALEQGAVRITVADRGVGIEPRHMKKIFRQFYRVQDSRLGSTPGLGLGLAFCKHVAEAHGGRMEADSIPGQGSTFSFVMPTKKAGNME